MAAITDTNQQRRRLEGKALCCEPDPSLTRLFASAIGYFSSAAFVLSEIDIGELIEGSEFSDYESDNAT